MVLPVRTWRFALIVGLAASSASAAELVVQWAPLPAAVVGVQVERKVDDGRADFAPIARVAGDATRFVDRGVSAGVRYCYRVRGVRGWSVSPPSAPLCNVASERADATAAVASAQPAGASANAAPAAQPPAPVANAAAATSNASASADAPPTADATLVTTDAALAMREPTVQRTPFEPSAPALAAPSASEPAASTASAPAASRVDAPRAAALDASGASAARASGTTAPEPAALAATESAQPGRIATLDAAASPLASAAPARFAAASSPEVAASAALDSVAVATPAPEIRAPAATAAAATLSASAPEAAPAASAAAPSDEVREVRALHRPRPEYPPYAQLNGLSGWVKVRFTVAADGSTRDVQIVASEPPGVFDASALGAARQFVYSPRLENGVAVDRPNVETEITYTWIQRGGAVVTEHVPQARR